VIAAKATTVYELTAAERAEWQAVLLPVHKQFESVIGADVIASVNATAAEVAREQAAAATAKPTKTKNKK
jgi:C4-dicarboxylate-binding protein DctP